MSSFLLKKSIGGKLCFSVSIWRNRLPNRIECLWRPMATMLYRKQRAEIGFAGSMMTILIWVTRSVKIGPGRLRTVNCSFRRGRYSIAKNACRAIECFSSSYFHAATCHGEGLKDRKMPHELNDRQMERCQNICQILLARQKRKSFLHRIVTGDEKWIYFQNPKHKKSWVDPAQPSTSYSRSNRFGRKTMLCVWWDQEGCHLLRAVKTWWNC